jgi:hypothetical protein
MGDPAIEGIKVFLDKVEQRFSPEKVILFGSRARGDFLKDSDYDIIVVSRRFEGCHFLDRLTMLFDLWDYQFDADILAYTPEEFEEKRTELGIVSQAVEAGIEVGEKR